MEKATELTAKAQKTKEHILATALDLFASKGYSETTLRNIAAEANVSLGLTYRYFEKKEDLVLALYERLSQECVERTQSVERGPLGQRFGKTVNLCLDQLSPHRGTLESLFAVGLIANSEVAVLGKRSAPVREKMIQMYLGVLEGSTERIRPEQVAQLKTLLYATHMLIIFFWLQDQSEDQTRTRNLVRITSSLLKYLKPILAFRPLSNALEEVNEILSPMFGPGG